MEQKQEKLLNENKHLRQLLAECLEILESNGLASVDPLGYEETELAKEVKKAIYR